MRLAALLVLLALAPALHAQGTPDPTPPEAYYPLAVGNQWEYRDYDPQPDPNRRPFERRTVTKDTTVAGRRYFIVREQSFQQRGGGTWDVDESRLIVRFDTAAGNVRRLYNGGADEGDIFGCRLDLPIPADGGRAPCSVDDPLWTYSVAPDTTIQIGSDAVVTSVRSITFLYFTRSLAAGIGPIALTGCEVSCSDVRLEYARVGGVTYGQKIAGLPAEPDPTPPADYYPLEVGNEWIYYESVPIFNQEGYWRRRITREETVAGQRYVVEEFCSYDLRATAPAWACGDVRLVRFDSTTTDVVGRNVNGEYVEICTLGADFDVELVGCSVYASYRNLGSGSVEIGGVLYPTPSLKQPGTLADPGPPPFAAGIGPLEQLLTGPLSESRFEYARVRGVEYGRRPVAGEVGAPGSETLALTASPNPTAGGLTMALTLPAAETVTVEAFDALGRRVWRAEAALGAGLQTLTVDAAAWAPGVYVVRATAGRATAVARVVRR